MHFKPNKWRVGLYLKHVMNAVCILNRSKTASLFNQKCKGGYQGQLFGNKHPEFCFKKSTTF